MMTNSPRTNGQFGLVIWSRARLWPRLAIRACQGSGQPLTLSLIVSVNLDRASPEELLPNAWFAAHSPLQKESRSNELVGLSHPSSPSAGSDVEYTAPAESRSRASIALDGSKKPSGNGSGTSSKLISGVVDPSDRNRHRAQLESVPPTSGLEESREIPRWLSQRRGQEVAPSQGPLRPPSTPCGRRWTLFAGAAGAGTPEARGVDLGASVTRDGLACANRQGPTASGKRLAENNLSVCGVLLGGVLFSTLVFVRPVFRRRFMWPYRVVPLWQHSSWFQMNGRLFFLRDLTSGGITATIQTSTTSEASFRSRLLNPLEHDRITLQRFSRPILTDQAEHPMIDQIPLRSSRRWCPRKDGLT